MSISGTQGHLLEVTVVGCNKLKDTEWISRQDPYVCLEYGSSKFQTGTHTDGGKNPTFQEKFIFSLIEGLRELIVVVWNRNTLTYDDFIGSGKVQLHKVLSQGFDDSAWPIQTKTGRHAGEVKLILHYPNANANKHSSKPTSSYAPSAPPNPQFHSYSAPHPTSYPLQASAPSYPPPPSAVPYPPVATVAYPASSPYPPYSSAYPPPPYPPPPPAAYPPPYPPSSAYPPSHYPPPPPPSGHYPPGPYPGMYPQPPY